MDQNSQYNGNSYPYPDEAGNRQPVSPHPVVVNQHTGLALAGVILSAIGLVIGVAILLLLLMVTF